MAAFFIVLCLLLVVLTGMLWLLIQPPLEDDGDIYIDDGIDHCKDCEICSRERCSRCVYNKYNK